MNTENRLKRTPVRQLAGEIALLLKKESPDYDFLRELFRHLRTELKVKVTRNSKKLPYIPTDDEIKAFHETVWKTRNVKNLIIFKTFLYTGIRVGELVRITNDDVDLDRNRICIRNNSPFRERFSIIP
jgi:integrase/recombinase XerD